VSCRGLSDVHPSRFGLAFSTVSVEPLAWRSITTQHLLKQPQRITAHGLSDAGQHFPLSPRRSIFLVGHARLSGAQRFLGNGSSRSW